MTIHVLIADDHRLMREGLTLALRSQADITVVGEAMDGVEALKKVELLRPDVLLLDVFMPVLDGIAVARRMHREFPDIHVVVLTMDSDPDDLRQLIDARIAGVVTKDAPSDAVARAIRAAAYGPTIPLGIHAIPFHSTKEGWKSPTAIGAQFALSQRERQILCAVAQGMNNREIALSFVLSERTVRNHLYHIFWKIAVEDRTQAALLALRYGLCADTGDPAQPATTTEKDNC